MTEPKNQAGMRILIVDDDRSIRKFLKVSLSSYGHVIAEAGDGAGALESILSFRPDVVILDLGLPDLDGIEVIKKVRKNNPVPIIILSVRDNQKDKIEALDMGADDYLTKPFDAKELNARLRAVLRRIIRVDEEPVFVCGILQVDFARRLVKTGNREADLTPTEYDMLKLLIMNAGKVVTHKKIMKQIWDKEPHEHEGMDHLLRVTVSNLRAKLETDPARPELIITEPAVGYRLVSE